MAGRTLTLDSLFQSGMVLQRRKPVKIWKRRKTDSGHQVKSKDHTRKEEKTGKGVFPLFLPPQEGMEDATLEIET